MWELSDSGSLAQSVAGLALPLTTAQDAGAGASPGTAGFTIELDRGALPITSLFLAIADLPQAADECLL